MQEQKKSKRHTSWNRVGRWYDKSVGDKGHHYHQTVVLPGLLALLALDKTEQPRLLDAACGQGMLARALPKHVVYHGVDAAPSLIQSAKERTKRPDASFAIADLTETLPVAKRSFSHAVICLALQNIEQGEAAIRNVVDCLEEGGQLVLVLNHPCYRIPRQTHWGTDQGSATQYRRVDRYMNALAIPIQTHPGQGSRSQETWSFHHPLSDYTRWLRAAGCMIEDIQEWCSDKVSTGKAAKMENRARSEIPLFMAISCRKCPKWKVSHRGTEDTES